MASIERDYYAILGVARDADTETIRHAFHRLAKEWHPDIADAPEAAARFRQLAEAYSVLTDADSRVLYDRYGYRGRVAVEAAGEGEEPEVRAGDIHTEVELTSEEAARGGRPLVRFEALSRCPACMGRGSPTPADPECKHCHGTGRRQTALYQDLTEIRQFTVCPVCIGEPCSMCHGAGTVETERRLRIRIPAGVADGAHVRVRGEGHEGSADAVPGDLYAVVHVLPPPRDWRAVRYASFALFLIAAATLVLYVLR